MFFDGRHAAAQRRALFLVVAAAGAIGLPLAPELAAEPVPGALASAEPDGDDGSDSEDAPEQPPQDPCAAQRAVLSRASSQAQMFNMSRFFVNGQSDGARERSDQFGQEVAQRVADAQDALQACYEKAAAAQGDEEDSDEPVGQIQR